MNSFINDIFDRLAAEAGLFFLQFPKLSLLSRCLLLLKYTRTILREAGEDQQDQDPHIPGGSNSGEADPSRRARQARHV